MSVLASLAPVSFPRAGCVAPKSGVVWGSSLLAGLVAATLLVWGRSAQPLDTSDWTLNDFAEYLRQHQLSLQVIPGDSKGCFQHQGFLTENIDTTWIATQVKARTVER